jgi:serine kinase of HPr protein (carbohydrate metabolism regulator)
MTCLMRMNLRKDKRRPNNQKHTLEIKSLGNTDVKYRYFIYNTIEHGTIQLNI